MWIDRLVWRHYIEPHSAIYGRSMSSNPELASNSADANEGRIAEAPGLGRLEIRIDELLGICQQLRDENVALKNQQSNLLIERAQLIERSELARTRVEAMIARLKAMESGS